MPNNTSDATGIDLDIFYQHLGFGSAAVVTNLIIIFIYIRNINLLKKSSFSFTLAIGDTIEGIALCASGLTRILRMANGTINLLVHPTYCMGTFVSFFMMGIQLPASTFVLIGVERFSAVYFFNWFRINWSNKLGWQLSSAATVFCTLSVSIAWVLALKTPISYTISNQCSIVATVDKNYLIYNYFFASFGGLIATIISCSAVVIFTKRKNRLLMNAGNGTMLYNHIKKQLLLTKLVFCTTIIDFILVVIPSIFLMLITGFHLPLPGKIGIWAIRLISWRSTIYIFVYFVANREFRQATFKAFGLKCSNGSPQVVPQTFLGMTNFPQKFFTTTATSRF